MTPKEYQYVSVTITDLPIQRREATKVVINADHSTMTHIYWENEWGNPDVIAPNDRVIVETDRNT